MDKAVSQLRRAQPAISEYHRPLINLFPGCCLCAFHLSQDIWTSVSTLVASVDLLEH